LQCNLTKKDKNYLTKFHKKGKILLKMRLLFFLAACGLIIFEILNVYFIMPMPGSQRIHSIDFAYFLNQNRWIFRIVLGLGILIGFYSVIKYKKWLAILALIICTAVIYIFNFEMAADAMFEQPRKLNLVSGTNNKVSNDRIIIGFEYNGEAKAYPISLIGYHHQIIDMVGGMNIMVTYCTVCRTGRVFEPTVNGKPERFRLVGMDHFNAMFEDATTKSWWRQANGEAITGPLIGVKLPELHSQQTSLGQWIKMYPNSLIMQADPNFKESYDSTYKYERGKSVKELTKTDSLSWKEKSWVLGIEIGKNSKAFDWNRIKKERIANETVGSQPVVLVLTKDDKSFFAFERKQIIERFSIKNDTLFLNEKRYNLKGEGILPNNDNLKPVKVYQEFWHSWLTFHRNTLKY
jgi:hypothetical protein